MTNDCGKGIFKYAGKWSSEYVECVICKVLVDDDKNKRNGHLRTLEHKKNVLFRQQLEENYERH